VLHNLSTGAELDRVRFDPQNRSLLKLEEMTRLARHLHHILTLPGIQAIQWVQGEPSAVSRRARCENERAVAENRHGPEIQPPIGAG
jgi:hypothetical protein